MRLASLLVVLFAWHATSAFGATVVSSRVDESDSGPPPQWTYTVEFKAAEGERNRVSVHIAGGRALIRDRAQRLHMRGGFCVRVSEKSVRCPADLLFAKLGDVDDELEASAEASETVSIATVERVDGGSGNDTIVLGYGGIADGGAGDDLVDADAGPLARSSILDGGTGSDRVTGSSAQDTLTGGLGDDVVRGRRGRDRVGGGGEGHDRIYGGPGADRLDDQDFYGVAHGMGPDELDGGRGRDILDSYRFRVRPVLVTLNRPGGDGQRGEGDALSRIENVWSGLGDDRLIGNATGNKIRGGEGDDVVRGLGGRDTLEARDHDRVRGGAGDDHIQTSLTAEASVSCDAGADRVSSRVSIPRRAGPLLGPDCERIQRRARGPFGLREPLAFDPVPAAIEQNGDMAFTVFEFTCCDEVFDLTRPTRPFEVLDSAPVDGNELTVTAPDDLAQAARTEQITLRAQAGSPDDRLTWRFRVGGYAG
jgi:hypothetical protein